MAKLMMGLQVNYEHFYPYTDETIQQHIAEGIEAKALPNPATFSDIIRSVQRANKRLAQQGLTTRFLWRLDYD